VNLIDKKNSWNYLSSAFFTPLSYFLIDLLSNFWLDFSNITCKKSQETLGSAIDNIYFMERYCMHDFLSFLELTLGALNKPCLGSNIIIITAS